MIALPLSILALAAGVYLLIKVNREYLGGLFKFFAWLVIALSLLSTGAVIRHGVHHFRHHRGFPGHEMREERIMMNEMHRAGNDSICPMSGCKMAGDSVVLDRAVCEKMMGKDACDKLCKDRGQCIMTKDECAKMCGGMAKCGGEVKSCCMSNGKAMGAACCKGNDVVKSSCCKK